MSQLGKLRKWIGILMLSSAAALVPERAFGALEAPTQEWIGSEYADVTYQYFLQQNPGIPLVFHINDIYSATDAPDDKLSWAVRFAAARAAFNLPDFAEKSIKFRSIESLRFLFNPRLQELIRSLEFGERIEFLPSPKFPTAETDLKDWILGQPEQSIFPHQLMNKALQMTEGHVFSAWALVWNVASERWVATPTRNFSSLRRHFAPLTGESHLWNGIDYIALPPNEWQRKSAIISETNKRVSSVKRFQFVVSKRGDEFSYLYHRIGVELVTMFISKLTSEPYIGLVAGKLGAVGEWIKYRQTAGLAGENKKRLSNDLAAAASGTRFLKLGTGEVKSNIPTSKINEDQYLKLRPSKYGESYQLPAGRPSVYFGSKVDSQFWAPSMSEKELAMRFYHATHYDSDILNPIILASNGTYERLHRGMVDYLESKSNIPALNRDIAAYARGVRAVPVKSDRKSDDDDISLEGENRHMIAHLRPNYKFMDLNDAIMRLSDRVLVAKSKNTSLRICRRSLLD